MYFITWDYVIRRIIEKPCDVNVIKNIIASYVMSMNGHQWIMDKKHIIRYDSTIIMINCIKLSIAYCSSNENPINSVIYD